MTVKIAIVQINQDLNNRNTVYNKTEKYLRQIAKEGADIVLFPETFTTGYMPNYTLWEKLSEGENMLSMLRNAATEHRFSIAVGHVELVNGEIYNTYIFINGKGEIVDRAIKNNGEAYIFKRGDGQHILKTEFGKIGVGICADNHISRTLEGIQSSDIDLYFMPHAWATPEVRNHANTGLNRVVNDLLNLPIAVTKMMGVPGVFINQLGDTPKMIGILGGLIDTNIFKLQGYSRIMNQNGDVVKELQNEEGFVIAEIELKKSIYKHNVPDFDGWTHKGSKLLRKIILPYDIRKGVKSYKLQLVNFLKKQQK